MKKILFLLICFSSLIIQAQECSEIFIENIEKAFTAKAKDFTQKSCKNITGRDFKQIVIINIPVIFATKEGVKLYSKKEIEREKLLCYLNTRKLLFDESFIYSDTTIKAVVSRRATYDGVKYELSEDTTSYVNFLRPLMIKVKDIAPDYIFRVYNLPQCYWYLKNCQLYVLYFKHEETVMENFETIPATDFIRDYLTDDDLVFLYHKRVEVISGK
ncbi:hypothetical protein ACT29H_06605 [Thermophagus sp. OGC60D27]|uniref:hypothetical protein n=1 Tax=Thermophagus sp. OGC60D27 TaxID=3458415 RepID=UPI0040383193